MTLNHRSRQMSRVSLKRAREQRQRMKLIRRLFAEPALCAVPGCTHLATAPHEPLTRARGGSITDAGNIVGLCHVHHLELHDTEPDWAYDAGLLRHSWDRVACVSCGAELHDLDDAEEIERHGDDSLCRRCAEADVS